MINTNTMATIKFYLQSNKNPAGIYVRIREGVHIDAKAKTKFVINPADWSDKKGQPINLKDEAFKALNRELFAFKNDLLNHFNSSIAKNKVINSDWLKNYINPPEKSGEIPQLLSDYFSYYREQKAKSIKPASKTKLLVIQHLIQKMEKSKNKRIYVSDVNEVFMNDFITYSEGDGYSINTIARAFDFVKTICYHAESNGISISPKLRKLVIKKQKVEKIFLTPEELKIVEAAYLSQKALINARDWLIISCETGQRVSDFLRFTKEMIRKEQGKTLIEFTQVKTEKVMTIPLSKKVQEILKKRKGNFPYKISDQRYNEYIKKVCDIAGLNKPTNGSIIDPETKRKVSGVFPKWQLVSSHIGRRSFASNYYGKIPTSLLISATGHASERQFLEYIGKSDTQKALALADYF